MGQNGDKREIDVELLEGPAVKKTVADLAILGGPRMFDREVYVGRPNIPDHASVLGRFEEVLQRGDRGVAVRAVQAALVAEGHSISVDGIYGPRTAAAVRR